MLRISSLLLALLLVAVTAQDFWIDVYTDDSYAVEFADGTLHRDVCFIVPVPRDADYHAVEFLPRVGTGHVDWFLVWGIPLGSTGNLTDYPDGVIPECYHHPHGQPRLEYVYAWSRGAQPLRLDQHFDVGFPLGAHSNIEYLMLEVSMSVPHEPMTVVESAGVRIRLTSQLRAQHAGLFVTGIETGILALPPKRSRLVLNNYNPAEAPYFELPLPFFATDNFERVWQRTNGEPLQLLHGLGHTNSRGLEVNAWAYRDGWVPAWRNITHWLSHLGVPNPYGDPVQPTGTADLLQHTADPGDSEWTLVNRYLYPGDSYLVQCTYSTARDSETVPGDFRGFGEMCNYIAYYTAPTLQPNHTTIVLVNFPYTELATEPQWVDFTGQGSHH